MLTRLLPGQIANMWDIIRYAIEQSVPPATGEHPDKMNRILAAALSGSIDIWASYHKEEDGKVKFEGLAVTQILYDNASQTKNLLLYSLYGYTGPSGNTWVGGIGTLAKFAKSRGCSSIVAYTQEQGIVKLAERLGADTSFTFIQFDVDKIVQKLNELGR